MINYCDSIKEVLAAIEVCAYLRERAQVERVHFDLTPLWFSQEMRKRGVSILDTEVFGVRVDPDDCSIASDVQQPHPDFVSEWRAKHVNWWTREPRHARMGE